MGYLGPVIDQNFKQQPSALPAFASMTSHLTEELAANTESLAMLRRSEVPVTFIWGNGDPYLHVSMARHMHAQVRRGEFHVLNAGHWPQMDCPEDTAKLMLGIELQHL